MDYEQRLKRLDEIVKDGKLHSYVGEVVTILDQLLGGTYTLSEARRIDAIISNYKEFLLKILTEHKTMEMRKAVACTLLKFTTEEDILSEIIKLVEMGIQESNISWSVAERLIETPGTYPLFKESILRLLHSSEEYHKMLGLGIIREYNRVFRRHGSKTEKKMKTASTPKRSITHSIEIDVTREQLSKDWLVIVRNIIRETKSVKIRDQAWSTIPTIANLTDEKVLFWREFVYGVLHDTLLEFQPNIQVQLPRINQIAKKSINEKIIQEGYKDLNSEHLTLELTASTIQDLLKNEDISGEYFELEQVFVRKNGKNVYSLTSSTYSKNYICYYCGTAINKEDKICENCGKEVLRCNICKQPISFGEEAVACKYCDVKSHFNHLYEWIKIQGKCPTCKRKLTTDEIISL